MFICSMVFDFGCFRLVAVLIQPRPVQSIGTHRFRARLTPAAGSDVEHPGPCWATFGSCSSVRPCGLLPGDQMSAQRVPGFTGRVCLVMLAFYVRYPRHLSAEGENRVDGDDSSPGPRTIIIAGARFEPGALSFHRGARNRRKPFIRRRPPRSAVAPPSVRPRSVAWLARWHPPSRSFIP